MALEDADPEAARGKIWSPFPPRLPGPGCPQFAQFTQLELAGPAAAALRRVIAALKWHRGK